MKTALLLRTKDGRKFLTHEKNLPSLIEFTKTFKAEIYLVERESGRVLELKTLANAICNPEYKQNMQIKRVEKIFPKSKKSRTIILKDAQKFRKFIRRRLLSGKPLSLKELKEKFADCNVTDACLCNHLATVRRELNREGHRFRKVGAGTYCLADSSVT